MTPVGVTDTVLAQIDLSKEPIKADGRLQRVRKLVIQPGGIVPWHSHDDRPALIYIVEGEIVEYNSNCSAPILHKAGEVATETLGTVALVEEPRRQDRDVAVVRYPARQDGQAHVRPQRLMPLDVTSGPARPDVTFPAKFRSAGLPKSQRRDPRSCR